MYHLKCFQFRPVLIFTQLTNLDSFKVKEFADDKFHLDENGGQYCKGIENTGGKGEIIVPSNFSFPTDFSKDLHCRHVKTFTFGKG